jgi:predicted ATPase
MPREGRLADTDGVISSADLPSGGLTGRSAETAAIRRALTQPAPGLPRLVTVTGLPGVGKTAASIAAAIGAAGHFPDGATLIRLDGLQDERLLPHTIAAALRLPDTFDVPPGEALAAALADHQLLMLLDTCEHLIGACAALASQLAQACPGVCILATSREPLRVPGEESMYLSPLSLRDSAKLFRQRVGPGCGPLDAETLRAVCARLDGLPLAIVLAARQLAAASRRILSLDALLAGLEGGYDFLSDPAAPVPRHQTMQAAIGWSHQLCTPAERLLWARLAVFEGVFCLKDAQEVCATTHLSEDAVEIGVTMLTERSLLLREGGVQPQYLMPATIRAYGLAMLRRIAEDEQIRRRYRRWRSGPRQDTCWQ